MASLGYRPSLVGVTFSRWERRAGIARERNPVTLPPSVCFLLLLARRLFRPHGQE